jgi:intracellular multiplication protein IcmW
MPDLSNKGVHSFWYKCQDPAVYKIISFMESVENWTLDGDADLEQAIESLASMLDNIGYIDLQFEDKIIKLAVSIKMGRMLRLLQHFDIAHPGAAAKILTYAKNNSATNDDVLGVFLRRNIVFERLHILNRVFAQDRLNIISEALGAEQHA